MNAPTTPLSFWDIVLANLTAVLFVTVMSAILSAIVVRLFGQPKPKLNEYQEVMEDIRKTYKETMEEVAMSADRA
jgi:hypothetical protein